MEHILLSKLVSKSIELGIIREKMENLIPDKSNAEVYSKLEIQENHLDIEIKTLKNLMIEVYWNKIIGN